MAANDDSANLLGTQLWLAVLHQLFQVQQVLDCKTNKVGGVVVFRTGSADLLTEEQQQQAVAACNKAIADKQTLGDLPALSPGAAEAVQALFGRLGAPESSVGPVGAVFIKALVASKDGSQELRFLIGKTAESAAKNALAAQARKAEAAQAPVAPKEVKLNPNQLAKLERQKQAKVAAAKKDTNDVFGNWQPGSQPAHRQTAEYVVDVLVADELRALLQQQGVANPDQLLQQLRERVLPKVEDELIMFGNLSYTSGLTGLRKVQEIPLRDLL